MGKLSLVHEPLLALWNHGKLGSNFVYLINIFQEKKNTECIKCLLFILIVAYNGDTEIQNSEIILKKSWLMHQDNKKLWYIWKLCYSRDIQEMFWGYRGWTPSHLSSWRRGIQAHSKNWWLVVSWKLRKNRLDFEIKILERDHHVQKLKGHYLGSYFHTGIESAPGPVGNGECGQIERVRLWGISHIILNTVQEFMKHHWMGFKQLSGMILFNIYIFNQNFLERVPKDHIQPINFQGLIQHLEYGRCSTNA